MQHQITQQAIAKAAADKATSTLVEQEKFRPTKPPFPKTTERPIRASGGRSSASSSNVYSESVSRSTPLDVVGNVVGAVGRTVGNVVDGISNMLMGSGDAAVPVPEDESESIY